MRGSWVRRQSGKPASITCGSIGQLLSHASSGLSCLSEAKTAHHLEFVSLEIAYEEQQLIAHHADIASVI